jgi:ATP-dependent Lon protease
MSSKRKYYSSSDDNDSDSDYKPRSKSDHKKKENNKESKRESKRKIYKPINVKTLEDKIYESDMDDNVKNLALQRYYNMDISDKFKQLEWIESLLKIPWKKFSKLPVSKNNKKETIQTYFEYAEKVLNESVYGMDYVKEEILNYIAQFISTDNNCMPRILALQGSPGIGKTKIIHSGFAKALSRPIKCISMGGLSDSSHFIGFDYTYSGSRYGLLVQTLIETGVMNPIIFMDELDKISNTNSGIEIQNLLIHLTDPVQNHVFQDKYFSGIHIDLSKVIFIFSYNDESLVSPILKDRIYTIRVPDPDLKTKIVIGTSFLPKEIAPNMGLNVTDIVFSDSIVKYIVQNYCEKEKGIRSLKKILETIYLKVNTARFFCAKSKYKSLKDINLPINISEDIVKECIKKDVDENYDYVMRHMFL